MDGHGHSPATTHASARDAHGHSGADPDFGSWLAATVVFLVVLAGVFVLPATHAAGPVTPERPLAPEPGEAGHFAEHLSAVQAKRNEPIAATQDELDRQRAAALYSALAGSEIADDSVPPQVNEEIAFLIKSTADSGLTFTRDGTQHDAIDMATFMLDRWEKAAEPIYSGETFIRRLFGHTVPDQKLNRVFLAGGGDKPVAFWLQDLLNAHRAGK
ncbi:MAG TPA: DUF5329 family protein [Planctomycetota bacterium]|nr:DUF5329 family protein [Planctomycetota bacterium]